MLHGQVFVIFLFVQALHQLSEFDRARDFLIRAQRIKPQDKDINTELEKLNKYDFTLNFHIYCKFGTFCFTFISQIFNFRIIGEFLNM